MKQADFVERLTQALDLRVRASRQQSFRAISIQQRIASKLTLDDLDRVWYNKGTKCDGMGKMLLRQKFILSH